MAELAKRVRLCSRGHILYNLQPLVKGMFIGDHIKYDIPLRHPTKYLAGEADVISTVSKGLLRSKGGLSTSGKTAFSSRCFVLKYLTNSVHPV